MSKSRMSGAAAAFVFVIVVSTGGALPSSATPVHEVGSITKVIGASPITQAQPVQEVFWERLCRMLKLCG